MKKTYQQPSAVMAYIGAASIICGSQDIKSNSNDITYGGVDTEGGKDPASRRQRNLWEDEEEEEQF